MEVDTDKTDVVTKHNNIDDLSQVGNYWNQEIQIWEYFGFLIIFYQLKVG